MSSRRTPTFPLADRTFPAASQQVAKGVHVPVARRCAALWRTFWLLFASRCVQQRQRRGGVGGSVFAAGADAGTNPAASRWLALFESSDLGEHRGDLFDGTHRFVAAEPQPRPPRAGDTFEGVAQRRIPDLDLGAGSGEPRQHSVLAGVDTQMAQPVQTQHNIEVVACRDAVDVQRRQAPP